MIGESSKASSAMYGALMDGLGALELCDIELQAYTRVVLPLDGYVFWQPTVKRTVQGSFHFSQETQQNEDETLGFATVLLSSKDEIVEFTSPVNTIFVGCCRGFRYAFSQQQGFYSQAGIWHYFGHSVIPAFASQLLDSPGSIDPTRAVTSNSLALWLALNNYESPYYDGFSNSLTLYPSFLTPPNLVPPYGAVHIEPTTAIQPIPFLDQNRDSYQLASDHVRITLYGLQSDAAIDFLNCVLQYSLDTGNFGLQNMPIITDGKRPQVELEAIAMQKVLTFDISYYQSRVAEVARQLITKATMPIILQ
jgi:hypothetical protein